MAHLQARPAAVPCLAIALFVLLPAEALGGPHWGSFDDKGCVDYGTRKYDSRLWDIPVGASWERTCARTPADVQGQHFDTPSRCENAVPGVRPAGVEMWGVFNVTDNSCAPRWGPFAMNGCTGLKVREYSARLLDIPRSVCWEAACASTPADVAGQHLS